MIRTIPSSLLRAICLVIITRIAVATDVHVCHGPRSFTLEISNHERAIVHQSELNVYVNRNDLTITTYPGTNSINFHGNNVTVAFKGTFTIEDTEDDLEIGSERISHIFTDRISGIAEIVTDNSVSPKLHDCRVVLLRHDKNRESVHGRIANEIRRLAESCVEYKICQNVNEIMEDPQILSSNKNTNGSLSSCNSNHFLNAVPGNSDKSIMNNKLNTSQNSPAIQSTINKLVDVAIAELIAKLKEQNQGTLDVPNLDMTFSTGQGILKTTGRFTTADGTFRDLTTIRRTSDAILSHEGLKFLASCGFGLDIANVKYDHYQLKYGIIKVHGKMSGDINGMAIAASVSADYNVKPCLLKLEYLEVTELGKMKINLTGLGALNRLASKLLNWITEKWRGDIVHTLEDKVRENVQSKLSSFDCERFRP